MTDKAVQDKKVGLDVIKTGRGFWSRYDDPDYVYGEKKRLLRIILTHSSHLVQGLDENSPESMFLKKVGLWSEDLSSVRAVGEEKALRRTINKEPVRNTLMHVFNSASVDPVTVDPDTLKDMRKLGELGGVSIKAASRRYRNFGEVLDQLFGEEWRSEVNAIGVDGNVKKNEERRLTGEYTRQLIAPAKEDHAEGESENIPNHQKNSEPIYKDSSGNHYMIA